MAKHIFIVTLDVRKGGSREEQIETLQTALECGLGGEYREGFWNEALAGSNSNIEVIGAVVKSV